MISFAALENLNQDEMIAVTGQSAKISGGADLSWTLSLNHQYANDLSKTNISKLGTGETNGRANVSEVYYKMRPNIDCTLLELCRLAISPFNNMEERKDANGNVIKVGDQPIKDQKWLVFKQMQGTLQIDQFSLSGTTFINQAGNPQSGMLITFYDDKPLKLRNLGFKSMSVEAGESGYFNTDTYAKVGAATVAPSFDNGQEKGFMGLNVHGNLHIDGAIKIFSVSCTGSSTSRC